MVELRPITMAEPTQALFKAPVCDVCGKDAVVEQAYSGRVLCGNHLEQSIRKKVGRELRKQLILDKSKDTTIFVAISGGKDSAVLLTMIVDLVGKRRDVRIVAGCVDEGIEGYRPPSMQCAIDLCEDLGVEFITTSYESLEFHQMDEVVRRLPMVTEKNAGASTMPCSYCGVFRRQGINALAAQVKADVMALEHNLDDMAQTVLMIWRTETSTERFDSLLIQIHQLTDCLRESFLSAGFQSKRFTSLQCIRNFQCIMKNAPTPKVLFDGDTEILLHKWSKMFQVLVIALYEWQTRLKWWQSKNLLQFDLIQ